MFFVKPGDFWFTPQRRKAPLSLFNKALEIDENDRNTTYTIPALSNETHAPVKGKLVVQKTTSGGKTWEILNKGLPKNIAATLFTATRSASDRKRMIFGSATGLICFSKNSGESWRPLKYQLVPNNSLKMTS